MPTEEAVGTVALCATCGYAIQVCRHRWTDRGQSMEANFWDHFVLNTFTCHVAKPKWSVREAHRDY